LASLIGSSKVDNRTTLAGSHPTNVAAIRHNSTVASEPAAVFYRAHIGGAKAGRHTDKSKRQAANAANGTDAADHSDNRADRTCSISRNGAAVDGHFFVFIQFFKTYKHKIVHSRVLLLSIFYAV
jgi:hypothetical protein